MMLLAELLTNFLPAQIKTRGAYLLSALVMTVLTLLVLSSMGHFFGQEWKAALLWASIVSACVALGYTVVYPFVRHRLTSKSKHADAEAVQ
ncbi:hypothetical protein [Streptomyces sp. NPDC051662]|uniref:hypothetical protein n=1 Tax=Streptomyces sp. NPDC051662 TaxID=3154750 RepID=UPI00343061EC